MNLHNSSGFFHLSYTLLSLHDAKPVLQFLLAMHYLSQMTDEQTLVMYSGHPLGLFPSAPTAPRLVITNGMVRTLIYKLLTVVVSCASVRWRNPYVKDSVTLKCQNGVLPRTQEYVAFTTAFTLQVGETLIKTFPIKAKI